MNDIINLSQLITRLAEITESDTGTARRFLRELFATLEEELVAGREVSVKGIGTFRRIDDPLGQHDPAAGCVGFIPDKVLAEAINAPFSMFEPVELADDLADEELAACDEPEQPHPAAEPESESYAASEAEAEAAEEICEEAGSDSTGQSSEEISTEEEGEEIPAEIIAEAPVAEAEEPEAAVPDSIGCETEPEVPADNAEAGIEAEAETEEESASRPGMMRYVLYAIAGVGLGLAIGYGISRLMFPPETTSEIAPLHEQASADESDGDAGDSFVADDEVSEAEAIESRTEKAADTPEHAPAAAVYDTVAPNRFLTTMSRAHYGGVMEYWVYIYEANKEHLGNPNRLEPGTRVVIPPMSSFAPDGDTPAARAEAVRLADEIAARFRRR